MNGALRLPPAPVADDSQERRGGVWGPRAVRGPQAGGTTSHPVLLRPADIAAILGVGRTKVFQMIARNELPVIRIGRLVRVPKDLFDDWLKDQVTMPSGFHGRWD